MLFTVPIWLAWKYNTTVINPNTGVEEPWTIRGLFNNGYYRQSKRAEIYHNGCHEDPGFDNSGYLEFQFGDIRLNYPCSVKRGVAGLMVVGDNDGFKKHYYLELDFKWSDEYGLVWWNNSPNNPESFKDHDFDLYARIVIKKNSLLAQPNQAITYEDKETFNKKLLKSATLIQTIDSANISIYEIPWTNKSTKHKQILVKLNKKKDQKGNPVVLNCSTMDKNLDVLDFIRSKKKIESLRDKQRCLIGWHFAPNTYLKIDEINLTHALNLNEIYGELNEQLRGFVVIPNQ